MESYVRIGGGVWKILPTLTWGRGVNNCQNHPYVINEWPLINKLSPKCQVQHLRGDINAGFSLKSCHQCFQIWYLRTHVATVLRGTSRGTFFSLFFTFTLPALVSILSFSSLFCFQFHSSIFWQLRKPIGLVMFWEENAFFIPKGTHLSQPHVRQEEEWIRECQYSLI